MDAPFVVNRSNPSSRYWSYQTSSVRLSPRSQPDERTRLIFEINSKGGGFTELAVCLNADGFAQIAEQMIKLNPDAVIGVMISSISNCNVNSYSNIFAELLQRDPAAAIKAWSKAMIDWLDDPDSADPAS